jgi:hypothetical protein
MKSNHWHLALLLILIFSSPILIYGCLSKVEDKKPYYKTTVIQHLKNEERIWNVEGRIGTAHGHVSFYEKDTGKQIVIYGDITAIIERK